MTTEITEPGVYDLPFEDYLSDPIPGGSLSNSGAKTLLNECPAIFAYEREHGRPGKAEFDIGHAAHASVLGDGMEIAVIPDEILGSNGATSTKAAKEFIAEARKRGAVPVKGDVAETVAAMATALREHPVAGQLLHPDRGTPEQSLFWIDRETGVWRRARLDSLPHPAVGRMVFADYKTCDSASRSACENAAARYGYFMQMDGYAEAVKTLGLAEEAVGLLIFQEKRPPHVVSVFQPSAQALRVAHARNRRALEIFKRCTETNTWPGYIEGIEVLDIPVWAERQHEMELAS